VAHSASSPPPSRPIVSTSLSHQSPPWLSLKMVRILKVGPQVVRGKYDGHEGLLAALRERR